VKWVALIVAGTLILDGLIYGLLRPEALVVSVGLLAVLGVTVIRARRTADAVVGWSLGPGLRMTDPDRPERVADVVLPLKALSLGVLGIGSPGSGKTESLLIGLLKYLSTLQPHTGWAAFDGKGQVDVYQKTVAAGCAPDAFFSTELPHSASMNLMAGNPEDVTDRLSKVLIGDAASTTYYADEQRSVLLIIVPLITNLGLRVNLRDLYVALSVEAAAAELLLLAQEQGVDEHILKSARAWYQLDFGSRLNNIKGMLNRLFVFVSGPYTDRINDYVPDLSLEAAVAEGQRLYFHLPESRFSKDVAIMIIEQLAGIAKRRQQGDLETVGLYPLVFDDWGALFHPGFKPFSARCRSAKMPLSFMFQSRAQLQDVSHTYETELDDNIATKVLFRINGQQTAEFACRLSGTFETREVSTSILGDRDGTSLSVREVPRLSPADFKALDPGQGFLSTLLQTDAGTEHALYKVRFPRVSMPGWSRVTLPGSTHTPVDYADDGLNLWARYMTPEALRQHRHQRTEAAA
jgi:hypothetical protein